MKQTALIVGSLAYDIIFSIHGDIKNSIVLKEGNVQTLNLMFTANKKQKYYGGTAGNIAYGLGQLKQNPLLFSIAGKDFKEDYKKHLKSLGVELRVVEKKDSFTATFYGISDEKYQQIGIWQPDAYGDYINETSLSSTISDKELSKISTAIFSPGTGISTRNHMLELRKKIGNKVKIIFDPSQVLSIFYDPPLLKECLTLSDILISNETEINQFNSVFSFSKDDIFDFGVEIIIETLGDKGVNLYLEKGKSPIHIPPIKPRKVVETTGAGDAFRAGLIYGMTNGYDLISSCKIGALTGSKSVEEISGQMWHLNDEEILNLSNLIK